MTSLNHPSGTVYLVGAGPGDPKLLTLRGKECLQQADVVLYDYLANPVLLDYVPAGAERIYVGRRGRGKFQDQQHITRQLIEHAQQGKAVVRLKGGDPFVFGRGGEEAEAVAEAGLSLEIVPGVTSAVAVPAYAGIPVTHRTMASIVTFVTGHEDSSKGPSGIEWSRVAAAQGTLVFLMGLKNLPNIVQNLLKEGKSQDTPVALIRWGTRADQRTVIGTLADIVTQSKTMGFEPPTLVVVGEVVSLRSRLNWFETRPLFGKRVLVTRPKDQAWELSTRITASGGEPIECPMIRIESPASWSEVDDAMAHMNSFQWVIFTSVNGVKFFLDRARQLGHDGRAFGGLRLCCIGPRTAEELERYGLVADLIPVPYQAEGVIDAMKATGVKGARILIPRAEVAREILPEQLQAAGAEVRVVAAYRSVRDPQGPKRVRELLAQGHLDVLTFTSSSTVHSFVQGFEGKTEVTALTRKTIVACIGPITAETARTEGLAVTVMAQENTVPALVASVSQYVRDHCHGRALNHSKPCTG